MADFLPMTMSFFFADDLAAVIAGQIGIRFTSMYGLRAQTTFVLRTTRVVLNTCGTTDQLPKDSSDILRSSYQLPEPNAGLPVWCSDY